MTLIVCLAQALASCEVSDTVVLGVLLLALCVPCRQTHHIKIRRPGLHIFSGFDESEHQWCTHIIISAGPVRVVQRVEELLLLSLYIIPSLLLFWECLPLQTYSQTSQEYSLNTSLTVVEESFKKGEKLRLNTQLKNGKKCYLLA